jgi:hypothetical protein
MDKEEYVERSKGKFSSYETREVYIFLLMDEYGADPY